MVWFNVAVADDDLTFLGRPGIVNADFWWIVLGMKSNFRCPIYKANGTSGHTSLHHRNGEIPSAFSLAIPILSVWSAVYVL